MIARNLYSIRSSTSSTSRPLRGTLRSFPGTALPVSPCDGAVPDSALISLSHRLQPSAVWKAFARLQLSTNCRQDQLDRPISRRLAARVHRRWLARGESELEPFDPVR